MNNDIAKDAEELLPCPFCGSAGKHFPLMGGVKCSNKECNGMAAAFSVAEWNTRATAADKERIAELQRTLSEKATECLREAADVNQLRAQLAAKTQECEGLLGHLEQVTRIASRFSEEVSVPEAKVIEEAGAVLDSARKEGE